MNNSNRTIEYKIVATYPDTIYPADQYNATTDQEIIIPSHSTVEDAIERPGEGCVEDWYDNGETKWVYFFDKDSLDILPWDTVRITGRGILERRAIDLKYLQDHNFTLTYNE